MMNKLSITTAPTIDTNHEALYCSIAPIDNTRRCSSTTNSKRRSPRFQSMAQHQSSTSQRIHSQPPNDSSNANANRRSPRILQLNETRESSTEVLREAITEIREGSNVSMTTTSMNKSTTDECSKSMNTNLKGTTDTAITTDHKDLFLNTQDGYAAALEDEVQSLVGGTSEKFVPEPSGEDILTDVINGLRRFKDAVR